MRLLRGYIIIIMKVVYKVGRFYVLHNTRGMLKAFVQLCYDIFTCQRWGLRARWLAAMVVSKFIRLLPWYLDRLR